VPVEQEWERIAGVNVFWVLLGIAVLGGVAVVASGRGEGLPYAEPDRADVTLPTDRLAAREDVDRLRFAVGLRGYRMDEVDDVLDRLANDIAYRDRQIAELEQNLAQDHLANAHPDEPAPEVAAEPVESAAMVPPVETPADPLTSRTLLVPLESYVEHARDSDVRDSDVRDSDRRDDAGGGEPAQGSADA
jgi:DivIVA domain-containing protein